MPRQRLQPVDEAQGVFPIIGLADVDRQQRSRGEYPGGEQDTPPRRAAGRVPPVQPPQRQNRRYQQQRERPHIRRQPYDNPQQYKGPRRIPPERPMREVQGDYEHHQKRNILAVKEGMGVKPRM